MKPRLMFIGVVAAYAIGGWFTVVQISSDLKSCRLDMPTKELQYLKCDNIQFMSMIWWPVYWYFKTAYDFGSAGE
jgi:hypothetical protein